MKINNSIINKKYLAKSDPVTLYDHLISTYKIAKQLVNTTNNLNLPINVDFFQEMVLLSAFIHDLGKMHPEFQEILIQNQKDSKVFWNYRHEIISVILILIMFKRDFIVFNINELIDDKEMKKIQIFLLLSAILLHHKPINILKDKFNTNNEYGKNRLENILNKLSNDEVFIKEELKKIYDFLAAIFMKYDITLNDWDLISKGNQIHFESVLNYYQILISPWNSYINSINSLNWFQNESYKIENHRNTNLIMRLAVLFRGLLISSDHLASASIEEIKIINTTIIEIFAAKTPKWQLNTIQKQSSEIKGNCFIFAPTGSGKTESALAWSDQNQSSLNYERIFFILPYTASCNKMHERLSKYYGPNNVGIIHHKAQYYYYNYINELEDGKYFSKTQLIRNHKNLVKNFHFPIKIITPFQILKLFFGYNSFEKYLIEFNNAKCIFDEIHAYDPRTIAQIYVMIRFLRINFNTKFLIMSATMPQFLKDLIAEALGLDSAQFNRSCVQYNEELLKDRTRIALKVIYELIISKKEISKTMESQIKYHLLNNARIMIVCNSVKTAKSTYNAIIRLFGNEIGIDKIGLLHGQLTLRDRDAIERKIDDLTILIGTQAIEVSLDIDFDVGFFEIAPLDAIVQRCGRINRYNEKLIPGIVYVFHQDSLGDRSIYDKKVNASSLEILKKTVKRKNFPYIVEDHEFQLISDLDLKKMVLDLYEGGLSEEQQNILDTTIEIFTEFINENLIPFQQDKELVRIYENLFNSIEVLPVQFLSKYEELLKRKSFQESSQYLVAISKKYKGFLLSKKKIEFDKKLKCYIVYLDYKEGFGFL